VFTREAPKVPVMTELKRYTFASMKSSIAITIRSNLEGKKLSVATVARRWCGRGARLHARKQDSILQIDNPLLKNPSAQTNTISNSKQFID
jgi:hypothetical protein